jgi:hypothetical protein
MQLITPTNALIIDKDLGQSASPPSPFSHHHASSIVAINGVLLVTHLFAIH